MVSTGVLIAGLVAIALTARATLRQSGDVTLPGAGALLAATALTRIGLWCSGRAWVDLIGSSGNRNRLLGAIYQSQLTKYLPAGGIIQAAGQVGLSAVGGVSVGQASVAYLAITGATVGAGLTIGSGLVFATSLPGWARAMALLGLLAPLLAHRRVLALVLQVASRISHRTPSVEALPPQEALARAFVWCVGTHLLYASGFAILLAAVADAPPLPVVVLGYAVAWVAGFLVVPLPSGVGIREAALVALVPGVAAGPLLAASLAQRLITIAAELLAASGNRLLRSRRDDGAQGRRSAGRS